MAKGFAPSCRSYFICKKQPFLNSKFSPRWVFFAKKIKKEKTKTNFFSGSAYALTLSTLVKREIEQFSSCWCVTMEIAVT